MITGTKNIAIRNPIDTNDYVVSRIVNNQNPDYPADFISQVNEYTGVLKTTIRNVCTSIHSPDNAPAVKDVVRTIGLVSFVGVGNGKGDFLSKVRGLYIDPEKVHTFLKIAFAAMGKDLMPNLTYNGKKFQDYSYQWRKRLEIVAFWAIAFQMGRIDIA